MSWTLDILKYEFYYFKLFEIVKVLDLEILKTNVLTSAKTFNQRVKNILANYKVKL